MKITEVETIILRQPDVDDAIADGSQDDLIVRIHTDEGIVGIGEVDSAPEVVQAAIDAPNSHANAIGLRHMLIGADPLDNEGLWAQDVSRQRLLRAARRGDPRDERRRSGALGHQGQGGRQAGLRAARHAAPDRDSGVRLHADAGHRGRGPRQVRRPGRDGLHGDQARLGAARAGRAARRPAGQGGPRRRSATAWTS